MTMTILRSYRLGGALARKKKVVGVREAHGIAKAKASPFFQFIRRELCSSSGQLVSSSKHPDSLDVLAHLSSGNEMGSQSRGTSGRRKPREEEKHVEKRTLTVM